MNRELTCEELVTYLSDYIDGDLNEELSAAARAHLATCQNCRVVLDSTQKTIHLFSEHGQKVEIADARKASLFDQIAAAFKDK